MKPKSYIPQSKLRMLVDYNQSTGEFLYKHRTPEMFVTTTQTAARKAKTFNTMYGGKPPSKKVNRGYVYIHLNNMSLKAHRLAWVYVYGDIPDGLEIDHINGDKADNRISNLRLATRSENGRNRSAQSNNTSGAKGVSWHKQRKAWTAQIRVNGRQKYLGMYASIEAAKRAYEVAVTDYHGFFGRVG